ncbi:chaperone modulator CbpM [Pseudanabaena sp. lw0831]|uniref:chaperone modulator CbpM n=1 Tax=Pseudanabaena sp. lw0831 TaxID=1357935 RepID=UPI00191604BA|nr:chaperone modulator CbpM [Pseudanabaena sp. lw0831]
MTDHSSNSLPSSLSRMVVSLEGEQLYTFEYAASITDTSITVVQVYVELGVIEPNGSMLHSREIARIAQIQRLRQDLGLNLVGAAIVLDMAQELAQLRARLKAYQSHPSNQL